MNFSKDIIKRLDSFFDYYKRNVTFLKYLSSERGAIDEIILLVSCYLEQLGNCLFPKSGSSKRSFELMLLDHSGERDEFNLISVANLSIDILWLAESVDYFVPKSGRIQLLSEEYKPLIKFIDQTNISLTKNSVNKLLISLCNNLKSRFKINPSQTKNKNCYGDEENVIESIVSYSNLRRIGAEIKEDNVRNLIKEYKYTSILYREYRCKAVHEAAGLYVDPNKFLKNKRPYFSEVSSHFLTHNVLKLEFPSSFLIECLDTCIDCTKKAIIGKGLLPLPIWNAICDLNEWKFLDVDGIEETKPIKLRIE